MLLRALNENIMNQQRIIEKSIENMRYYRKDLIQLQDKHDVFLGLLPNSDALKADSLKKNLTDLFSQLEFITQRGQSLYFLLDRILLPVPCTSDVADLGRPVIVLNFEEVTINKFIRVFRGIDCVNIKESYFHPHVGNDGAICYGNAASQISKELLDLNLLGAIKYVRSLLLTYNPESPYRQLSVINSHTRDKYSDFYAELLGDNL
jgi:hypothetical protein